MHKQWRWNATDTGAIEDLIQSTGVSPIVAQMLASRGVTDATQVQSFLNPKLTDLRDPESLPGLPQAADRLYARWFVEIRLSSMAITMPTE